MPLARGLHGRDRPQQSPRRTAHGEDAGRGVRSRRFIGRSARSIERLTARERVTAAFARIRRVNRPEVWITLRNEAAVLADADAIDRRPAAGAHLALARPRVALHTHFHLPGPPPTAPL